MACFAITGTKEHVTMTWDITEINLQRSGLGLKHCVSTGTHFSVVGYGWNIFSAKWVQAGNTKQVMKLKKSYEWNTFAVSWAIAEINLQRSGLRLKQFYNEMDYNWYHKQLLCFR